MLRLTDCCFHFQALGIISVEDIAKLREYILPHTKCVKCLSGFNQTPSLESHDDACDHRFALERNTVLMHLENFLTEMQQQRGNKSPVPQQRGQNAIAASNTTISRLIEPADIRLFWKSYENCLPHEIESLWNIIENGLNKYLSVCVLGT